VAGSYTVLGTEPITVGALYQGAWTTQTFAPGAITPTTIQQWFLDNMLVPNGQATNPAGRTGIQPPGVAVYSPPAAGSILVADGNNGGTWSPPGAYVPIDMGDTSGLTDIGPVLQAVLDAGEIVNGVPGATYYLNSAVFVDNTFPRYRAHVALNGATLKLGPNVPRAVGTLDTSIVAGIFNNTLRSSFVQAVSALAVPATTVDVGSNGGAIATIASWATPSPGVLAVVSTAGLATSGAVTVVTSLGLQTVTYTGTSGGNQLTGCVPTGTATNGVVATGAAVTQYTSAASLAGSTLTLAATTSFSAGGGTAVIVSGASSAAVSFGAASGTTLTNVTYISGGLTLGNGNAIYQISATPSAQVLVCDATRATGASFPNGQRLKVSHGLIDGSLAPAAGSTVAAGSNAVAATSFTGSGVLNLGTMPSAPAFTAAGTVRVVSNAGVAVISYAAVSGTTLTGCKFLYGAAITLATGQFVVQQTPVLVADNTSSTQFDNVGIQNALALCWWWGYSDGHSFKDFAAQGVQTISGMANVIVGNMACVQENQGDNLRFDAPKAASLAQIIGNLGASITGMVGDGLYLGNCTSVHISGAHADGGQPVANGPATPMVVDCSNVVIDSSAFVTGVGTTAPGRSPIVINDHLSTLKPTDLLLRHVDFWTYYYGLTDIAADPDINIVAMNKGSLLRCRDCTGKIAANPRALRVTSTVTAIQTALTAGADIIAGGSFDVRYQEGGWAVTLPNNAAMATNTLGAPSAFTAAGITFGGSPGTLVSGGQYQYVAAFKNSLGQYTPLSAASVATTQVAGTNSLTINNDNGVTGVVALWRVTGSTGVLTAPDHYVEMPMGTESVFWLDTGANINGTPWATGTVPIPNTVAGTGIIYPNIPGAKPSSIGAPPLSDLLPTGWSTETMPRSAITSNTSGGLVSGTLYMAAVYLTAGTVVHNLTFVAGTVPGATMTHWWMGLYDSSRVQLATTADQTSAAIPAATLSTQAIAATAAGAATSFTTTYTGLHYIGLMVAATTVPNLLGVGGAGNVAFGIAPILSGISDTAQTAPPAFPHTATTLSATAMNYLGAS
jgi:hypothetical protein